MLGAKIYRTPTEAAYENHESHTSLAKKINTEIPNSQKLWNPLLNTAQEILDDMNDKDFLLMVRRLIRKEALVDAQLFGSVV